MRTEVLIAGGGPIGLALAVELGMRGIRTTLVEQAERKALQPRAKTTNVRSMEHMRRWGIAKRLRDSAPLPPDFPTDVAFQTRLFGHHLTTFHNAFYGARDARNMRPRNATDEVVLTLWQPARVRYMLCVETSAANVARQLGALLDSR